jgi:hypothetical protein
VTAELVEVGPAGWEGYLAQHCPQYLLPHAQRSALSLEVAERVLARLTGKPGQLDLLRHASLLSARLEQLERFAHVHLPALCRVLPSTSETVRRVWEGGYKGRLDVKPTLAYRVAGDETHFVTRNRRRSFVLPENVLVRAVAEALLSAIELLRKRGVIAERGWGVRLLDCEVRLMQAVASTALAQVPRETVDGRHLQAALNARHPCYRAAAAWHRRLQESREDDDPQRLARLVAEGALMPVSVDRRFELAVLIRLIQGLEARAQTMEPGRWSLERSLVLPGRKEVAALVRDDGSRLAVYYDQMILPGREHQATRARYLGVDGSARPDITLVATSPEGAERAAVIEIKNSSDAGTLMQGMNEARVYRWEYREHLTGWPKAVLVAHPAMASLPLPGDDVVAVGWDDWAPDVLLDGLLGR